MEPFQDPEKFTLYSRRKDSAQGIASTDPRTSNRKEDLSGNQTLRARRLEWKAIFNPFYTSVCELSE